MTKTPPVSPGWTRRSLLQGVALALPALAAWPHASAAPEVAPEAVPSTPVEPTPTPRKVVVIGAGLAGLSAACELNQRGHEVTVLEAQMRPGGRVYTLRTPFADGLYAEAGAMTFSDSHYIRHYFSRFGLHGVPLSRGPLAAVYHQRGKRFVVKPGEKIDWPYELSADERGLGMGGLIRKLMLPAAGGLANPSAPGFNLAAHADLDQQTFAGFLTAQGASAEAIALLRNNLVIGYGWETGSALHRLLSDFALFGSGSGAVSALAGGSDRLPLAFARELAANLRYGAVVTRIEHGGDRVVTRFRQAGSEHSLEADHLICALPVPALARIEINPGLASTKRQIFAGLEHTAVTRVFVQTRRRIWEDGGAAGTCFSDLPVQLITEQPLLPPAEATPRGILEAHVKGEEAARLDRLDPEARLAGVLASLEKIHPGIAQVVEGATTVSWGRDPWAGGGYAWWKPGQLTSWPGELARAEGRLHFAGDQTSALARTVEGALESGVRAAREVDPGVTVG